MKEQSSAFSKFKLIITLAFMSSLAPLSTDMYLPALSEVQKSFATSSFLTQLSLASFFIAFSLGQLIYGPISDVYGRKKSLYIGVLVFILSSAACISFDSIYAFIFFRFTQALGGCVGVVIAIAIVNDKFNVKEAAGIFALMMVISSLAPMLAPTFGGIFLEYFSWQFIFGVLFGLGAILLLMIIFWLDESAKIDKTLSLNPKALWQNYKFILKDRRFRIYIFSAGFAMAAMFAYITGSAFVFTEHFGLSARDYGILFGINALGFAIFANINAKIAQKISPYQILPYGFLAMLSLNILLIIFGFMRLGFVYVEICLFLIIGSLGFIVPNTTTLAMARFKQKSGSASAVLGTVEFAMAGIISFVVGALKANHPLSLAIVMASCVLMACVVYFSLRKKKFSIKNRQ
ncbi:multidrug effflux MFS transporter [Campylobacter hyointestinalis]|uniref:multidrug effflux MFS transporter n=1 Tax=Campylobacter hyointestinalis TaxID=198 RepID=UPI000DCC03C1|nr:multidrug effflux MFS transporter [Campylobacter hyointestinalis]RAZ52902.1 Bcr/CflA family drug resistance efflux transporter [Campylobacter hyointestinalis subsp. lawsonii]